MKGWDNIYDPKTNTFGVYNPNGKAETFFKPPTGNYYNNVIQKELQNGGTIINPLEGISGISGGGLGNSVANHPSSPVQNPFTIEE